MKCWARPFFIRAVKMRKCCDRKIQSPYFSDPSVPVIPGIWPSSPVFGPGIPWMFGLYSGCSRFCLQFKWALWPIKLEDDYLESSKQMWNPRVCPEPMVWHSEGSIDGRSTRYSVWSIPGQSLGRLYTID